MTVIATPRRLSMIRIIRNHPWVHVYIYIYIYIFMVWDSQSRVEPGSGILSPLFPITEPGLPEGRLPGRAFDEPYLGLLYVWR